MLQRLTRSSHIQCRIVQGSDKPVAHGARKGMRHFTPYLRWVQWAMDSYTLAVLLWPCDRRQIQCVAILAQALAMAD